MTAPLSPALMVMAEEAGFEVRPPNVVVLDCPIERRLARFAAMVAAAEREACARFGEQKADEILKAGMLTEHYAVLQYAQAIRARGQP